MHKKKEFWIRLTALTLTGLGCADLNDADPCYRFARLVCEKAGADDAGCRDPRRTACYADIDESDNADVYSSCANHLDALGDCLTADQLQKACPEVPGGLISLSCGAAGGGSDVMNGGSAGAGKGGSSGSGGTGGSKGGTGGSTGGSGGSKGGTGGSRGGTGGSSATGGTGGSSGSFATGGSSGSFGTGGTGGTAARGGTGGTSGTGGSAGAPFLPGDCASLADDFSLEALNPSGLWSYGYTSVLRGSLSLLPTFCSTQDDVAPGSPSIVRWTDSCGTSNTLPMIGVNPSGTTIHAGISSSYPAGTNSVPPGTAVLHPGAGGQYAVARWKVPVSASYVIDVTFSGDSGYSGSPVTTTEVYVFASDTALFSGALNSGLTGNTVSQSLVRDLVAGNTLDFVVGPNGSWSYDSTGVDAVICAK